MRNKKSYGDKRQSRHFQDEHSDIDQIIAEIQNKLSDSTTAIDLPNLNAFERKRVHSYFDNDVDFQTKTYRIDNEYILKIYPIGNLKRMADKMARQVLESGESIFLSNLGNYERFIIHDHLKSFEGIETISTGEGDQRVLEIKRKQFGRSLRRIIKKIKLI